MSDSELKGLTRLNADNYQTWKFRMEMLLIKNGLWDVVKSNPIQEESGRAEWKQKDDKARAIICLSVDDTQLVHVRKTKTAKEAWDELQEYHEKSTLTNKVFLLRQICNLKLNDGGSMETHIQHMQELVDKLAALGEELKENLVVAMLLSSLPDSYGTLITALESRPEEELTLSLVKGKLSDEYTRKTGVPGIEDSNTALKVEHRNAARTFTCFFCKKPGHVKKDCTKYKKWKGNSAKPDKANIVEEVEENFLCFNASLRNRTKDKWYIDSGATSHMTGNKDFFMELKKKDLPEVILANGRGSKVEGIGYGELKCIDDANRELTVKLTDVLYVPELSGNLMSVKKLTTKGFEVTFEESKCRITKNNVTFAIGTSTSNMYTLQTKERAQVAQNVDHTEECEHTWHRKFGHRNLEDIRMMQKKNLVIDMKIKDCGLKDVCECCLKGKLSRPSFPKSSTTRAKSTLELVHTDLCGPMPVTTPSGNRYFMTIIDDYSRYTEVYFLKEKTEVENRIKEYVEYVKNRFDQKPKVIRSDNGTEYVNGRLRKYFKKEGIKVQHTAPYTPQQNGVAERKNRTLMEAARCMLIDAELDKRFWAEAVNTANYLQNRLPSTAIEATPYQLWNKEKPKVNDLQIFGCKGYAVIPKEKRRKLDDKAEKLTFVGYEEGTKGYRMLNSETSKITVSRDVKFIKDSSKKPEFHQDNTSEEEDRNEISTESTNERINVEEEGEESMEDESDREDENASDEDYIPSGRATEPANEVRRSTRTTRGKTPNRYKEGVYVIAETYIEPTNYKEATTSSETVQWEAAMNEEIQALKRNQTWKLVSPPKEGTIVGSKWTYKRKEDSAEGTIKYKARLVAKGFSQKYGTDYDEVFAPVVRMATIRTILTVAGERKLHVHHLDAKSAFLNGKLKEEVYMQQPQGFEEIGKEQMVCKLNKSIYGLKQAARVWNELKRVTRYLKGTKTLELKLGGDLSGLICYTDADWAENREDRKSNSGYLIQLKGAAVEWGCRKQSCVALSSCEAEYIALAEASKEVVWMRRLLQDLGGETTEPTVIMEDNQSVIRMIENDGCRNRTKHIDTRYHFAKELVEKGTIKLQYCPSEDQTADMLTKAVNASKLGKHRTGCNLRERREEEYHR